MNLMFWKKKPTTEDSKDDSREKPDGRTVSQQSPGRGSRYDEASEDTDDKATNADQARPKRGLIVVGSVVGVIVLATAGLAAWKFFPPTPKKVIAKVDVSPVAEPLPLPDKQLIKLPPIGIPQLRKVQPDNHQTDAEASQNNNEALRTQIGTLKAENPQLEKAQAEKHQADIDALMKMNKELQTQITSLKAELPRIEKTQAKQHQANIDALTKKNKELQAQIDALKKKQPQPSVSPTEQTTAKDKTPPPTHSSDTAISNKNPKGAAMTVKELIDAMNASSGNSPQKPAK
jgi:hypothetical protein